MDIVIKNGTVINADGTVKADVGIKNGKIAAIGTGLTESAELTGIDIVDATGKFVLPGAIDVHTHLSMPFGSTVSADSYFTGTQAAACGGTTMIIDFAMQERGESMVDTIKRRDELCAQEAVIDYAFHIGITDISGSLLDTMQQAVDFGVPTFKVYMVYDFGVDDGVLYRVLEKTKEIGAMLSVHAENRDVIAYLTKRNVSEGKTSVWHHYMSRPEFAEGEAVHRAITWAKSLDAPLYIVHLACTEGVDAVIEAKKTGYEIYAETCPHYLEFTSDVYKREDGRNFVCSPPIKGKQSQDALWKAISKGLIDTVATDHCPFMQAEKDWGLDDFTKIPNGCGSIEQMYPYMLSAANTGKISFEKAVELCSAKPAQLFGCADKGIIAEGKDADIVIYDPALEKAIKNTDMHTNADHTIWEGVRLKGYPVATYSRGNLVFKDGEFLGSAGSGWFIKRKLQK